MSLPRLGLRSTQRLRTPFLRSTIQRRFESTTPMTISSKFPQPGQKLEGVMDNAFNRERAAVKAHAQATSGNV